MEKTDRLAADLVHFIGRRLVAAHRECNTVLQDPMDMAYLTGLIDGMALTELMRQAKKHEVGKAE